MMLTTPQIKNKTERPDRVLLLKAGLDRIKKRIPAKGDVSLDRITVLLDRLGDPHLSLPPIVHIAGTNGKGSVLAFLKSILNQSGYQTHRFVSPHLVRFNERIELNGDPIDDAMLLDVLTEVEEKNKDVDASFFEMATAMAFLAYTRVPSDVLLLETGLGGRLDATNVVTPAVSVVSSISIDHQQFLGQTLEDIAFEKAGIMKPGVPCVVGKQPYADQVLPVLKNHAEKTGAPLFICDRDWRVEKNENGFVYCSKKEKKQYPLPGLKGDHQIDNAGLALAVLDVLNSFECSEADKKNGLEKTFWPGRLQKLVSGPLVDILPDGWEIWIDGGHNIDGARVLAAQAEQWSREKPLHLIVGMLKSKDPNGFCDPIVPHTTSVGAVSIPNQENSLMAEELAKRLSGNVVANKDLETAVKSLIIQNDKENARILIAGSLYLVGEVLKNHQ